MSGKIETKVPPLKLSRLFQASPPTVFRAWSSAEHVKRWFCPDEFTIPDAKVELKIGGAFDVCMRSRDGRFEHWMRGRFTEVVPPERLAFESTVNGPNGQPAFHSVTTVTFEHAPQGTRLTVEQAYTIKDEIALKMIEGASAGWSQTLDRLEREVASHA